MIGTKIARPVDNYEEYAKVADWCNHNNAVIIDYGNYYMVEEVPVFPPSQENKLAKLNAKLATIKNAHQGALLMGNDTSKLMEMYRDTVEEIKELQKKGE